MTQTETESKTKAFVSYLSANLVTNTALRGAFRRADNPASEHLVWDTLSRFGVDLERDYARLAFATVGAAMAKSDRMSSGSLPLGLAIRMAFDEGLSSAEPEAQALARLRRVLACDNTIELCHVLRSLLALINSRVDSPLNYARLLENIQKFHFDPDRVKAQIAQDFFRGRSADSEREASGEQEV